MDGHVRLVDLVDEQKARDVLVGSRMGWSCGIFVEFAPRPRHRPRAAARMSCVNRRARTIDKGIAVAHEVSGGDQEARRSCGDQRLLAGIADRSPHRPCPGAPPRRCGSGSPQQCGLALKQAHQCNAPGTRHSCAVLTMSFLPCDSLTAIVSGRGDWQEAGVSGRLKRSALQSCHPERCPP